MARRRLNIVLWIACVWIIGSLVIETHWFEVAGLPDEIEYFRQVLLHHGIENVLGMESQYGGLLGSRLRLYLPLDS